MKYSLIVPVYNVDKYLSRCLDSIISQSYNNFEVICVNDGSTDRSKEILESYIEKDTRITLINQDNKGLGEARNTAFSYVKGDYIWFIDSDDWISDSNALLKINNIIKADNSDILMFDYYYGDEISYKRCSCVDSFQSEYMNSLDYIKYSLVGKLRFFAWLKIFKTDIFKKNNFKFPRGWYEDVPIISIVSMLPHAKISYLQDVLYHYYNRPGSIMNSYDNRLLHLIDRAEMIVSEFKHKSELKKELTTFYNGAIATILIRSQKSNDKAFIRGSLKIKMKSSFSEILNDHNLSARRKLLLIVFKFSSLNFFNKIF